MIEGLLEPVPDELPDEPIPDELSGGSTTSDWQTGGALPAANPAHISSSALPTFCASWYPSTLRI